MNKIIASGEKTDIIEALKTEGFEPIFSETLESLPIFERSHADLQCLRINDTFFVLQNCHKLRETLSDNGFNATATSDSIGSKYPENVLLNAVFFNNRLYGKLSALDDTVTDYCRHNNIELVNVNQGYAKCSTAIIRDRFITADKGIFKAMSERGERGLLISSGNIVLSGVDYGFIGGCCFECNNKVYFSGDISKHPDYKRISEFCDDMEIVSLSDKKLYDIGGFVVL